MAVEHLERSPYPYATSFPLEEVHAYLQDRRVLHLILKDLTWERLLGAARGTKPRFLYEPRRSIETHRRLLPGTGFSPECYAAHADDGGRRYWLLLEKVAGVELWQVGTFETWEAVARGLARFHRMFAARNEALAERNPYLLRYRDELFLTWPRRVLEASTAPPAGTPEREGLERIASGYGEVVRTLATVPPTLVHGELYPSNVLVDDGRNDVKVWALDWEMAGIGPAFLDVVALTAGWDGEEQRRLVSAYLDELGPAPWWREGEELARLLDCCRLHYALQWLGWSDGWLPPREHAHDWTGEALEAAKRLRL